MDTANNTYLAFQFSASELSAFAVASGIFTISIKNGKIVHFCPNDVQHFHDWLTAHEIRDIQKEEKTKPTPPSTNKSWWGRIKRNK